MPQVSALLNRLLEQSVQLNASDIHITSGVEPYMRLDKGMKRIGEEKTTIEEMDEMAFSLMSEQQRHTFLAEHSLDMAFFSDNGKRYRVNIFQQRGSLAMSIRRLDEVFRNFDELQLPPQYCELANFHNGLVLVTGPTGSGKSTSLAAVMHQINANRACHIITIEDPIEYIHRNQMSLVRQREVHSDVPSFAAAVRAALREDPDVLLVGEMRDLETMRAAITAAETGHMVFSTLHTNDVASTVGRMIGVFPSEEQKTIREQLSRVLRAVVSQKLLPRIDKPGRVPILEILRVNSAIANLIRTGDIQQIYSVIQTGSDDGMLLLEQSLAELSFKGLVSVEDAIGMARDPSIFESRYQSLVEAKKAAEPGKRRGFSLLRI